MSLKKIAELAGTSISTVSRVLNTPGHSCHTPGLSEKIWKIAKELEYIPNTTFFCHNKMSKLVYNNNYT